MKVLKKQNTQENNINNQIRRIDKTKKKLALEEKSKDHRKNDFY